MRLSTLPLFIASVLALSQHHHHAHALDSTSVPAGSVSTDASTATASSDAASATSSSTDSTAQRKIAKVASQDDFCMFLPPAPGLVVAPAEPNSTVFCSQPNNALGPTFPSGLVLSEHFYNNVTSQYVQVTGCIDITKYNLQGNDEGGQYDSHGSPPAATCEGYNYFVNVLEPASGDYCIRCCQNKADCNTGYSQGGCYNLVRDGSYTLQDNTTLCPQSAYQQNLTATTSVPGPSATGGSSSSSSNSSNAQANAANAFASFDAAKLILAVAAGLLSLAVVA